MSTNHPSGESIDTRPLVPMLTTLLAELTDGPPPEAAYILNRDDIGLLRSLDKLTASDASVGVHGGATIAAHVDHLRYGLSLMNRWSAGEQPFEAADWAASWRTTTVSDADCSARSWRCEPRFTAGSRRCARRATPCPPS